MIDQSTTPPTIVNVHLDNTNYATAAAAATAQAAAVPAARKSAIVAYLALAVGWLAGLHRFYLRKSPFRWLAFFWLAGATAALITPHRLVRAPHPGFRVAALSTLSSFLAGSAVITAGDRRRSRRSRASLPSPRPWTQRPRGPLDPHRRNVRRTCGPAYSGPPIEETADSL